MSRSANPIAVGAFILGMLVLAFLLVLFFTGGHWFTHRDRYTLVYDTSIKGLNVGAPVTLKGVKIGEVTDIKARMLSGSFAVLNDITLEIDPKMLEREGQSWIAGSVIDDLIQRGLCSQLRLQSLLTGLLYVDVDFHPEKQCQLKDVATEYKQIPTTPTDLEQLTRDLEAIDINKLGENLQQIVAGVNTLINDHALQDTIKNINAMLNAVQKSADTVRASADNVTAAIVPLAQHGDTTVNALNQKLPALLEKLDHTTVALQETAASLQKTSANATYLTSEDSPLLYRIESAAASVNAAAAEVRHLSDTLERQPEALLYGKQEN